MSEVPKLHSEIDILGAAYKNASLIFKGGEETARKGAFLIKFLEFLFVTLGFEETAKLLTSRNKV